MTGSASHQNPYRMLALVACGIVILDQIAKAAVLHYVPLHQGFAVIPGFFNITHIHNPGGAFGFLAKYGSGWGRIFFTVASMLAIGVILYFYQKTPATQVALRGGFALILGGAVGNLIDRVRFGKVVDFLDVYIGDLHWPAFNVADSAVSIGIVIFAFHLVFNKLPE
ncbi:MAG: signal peptidase II [Desulfobacterales bacterium]|nr:signal peptidase II [Desulfobacterales bacterium]